MRADGDLTESVVGLRNLAFLFNPAGSAVAGYNGNLAVTGLGADDGAQGAQLVFFCQRLNKRALVLVGTEEAALGVGADLQGVVQQMMTAAVADHIPERLLVLIGRTTHPAGRRLLGTGSQRARGGIVHLAIHLLGALHALDGMAEVDNLLLHTLVLLGILGAHYAVLVGMFVQKRLGTVPGFGALLAHFKNLAHVRIPPDLSVVGFDQIQSLVKLICGNAGFLGLRLDSGNFRLRLDMLRFGNRLHDDWRFTVSHSRSRTRSLGIMAIQPHLHLRLRIFPVDHMRPCTVGRTGLRISYRINEAVRQRRACVHPCGCGHHGRYRTALQRTAACIDVEDALLTGAQKHDRFIEIPFIAPGKGRRVVNHIEAAGRHLQRIGCHRQHRRCGSRRAGDHQMHLAGIGADIVVHPGSCIAGAAVAVEDDAHIVGEFLVLAIQRIMQHGRRDLVAVPDFLIDIAVQIKRSHGRSPHFP